MITFFGRGVVALRIIIDIDAANEEAAAATFI